MNFSAIFIPQINLYVLNIGSGSIASIIIIVISHAYNSAVPTLYVDIIYSYILVCIRYFLDNFIVSNN